MLWVSRDPTDTAGNPPRKELIPTRHGPATVKKQAIVAEAVMQTVSSLHEHVQAKDDGLAPFRSHVI
jgi:hypothetical protein